LRRFYELEIATGELGKERRTGFGDERVPVAEEVLQFQLGHGAIEVGEGGIGAVMEEVRHAWRW
jgi:hypothetical protein